MLPGDRTLEPRYSLSLVKLLMVLRVLPKGYVRLHKLHVVTFAKSFPDLWPLSSGTYQEACHTNSRRSSAKAVRFSELAFTILQF